MGRVPTRTGDLAAHSTRVLQQNCPSEQTEGAGKAGCSLHPWPPREKSARGVDHRYRRKHSGLPCASGFTAYFVLSLVSRAFLPPSPCGHPRITARLGSARIHKTWRQHRGARTTRLRRPLQRRSPRAGRSLTENRPAITFARDAAASIAFRSQRVVTMAIRPSDGSGIGGSSHRLRKRESEIFSRAALERPIRLNRLGKLPFRRKRLSSQDPRVRGGQRARFNQSACQANQLLRCSSLLLLPKELVLLPQHGNDLLVLRL